MLLICINSGQFFSTNGYTTVPIDLTGTLCSANASKSDVHSADAHTHTALYQCRWSDVLAKQVGQICDLATHNRVYDLGFRVRVRVSVGVRSRVWVIGFVQLIQFSSVQ